MEENIFKLCLNLTNSNHSELQNCYDYNGTNENVTLDDTEHTVEEASNIDLDRQVKYYCEGVILVPLAFFGLFGKKETFEYFCIAFKFFEIEIPFSIDYICLINVHFI